MTSTVVWANETAQFQVALAPAANVNTATWTLRNDAGAVVAGFSNVALSNAAGATTALVDIGTLGNQLANGATTTARFLEVSWVAAGGVRYRSVTPYRIAAWVGLSITPSDVRGLVGLNEAELPDADLDLVGAALALRAEIGNGFPTGAAVDQRLVALRSFLDMKASLPLRVASAMSSDNVAFKRLANLKVDEVITRLEADYGAALALVSPTAAALNAPPTPTVLTKARSTLDPITGA
jgi:hypothetical protein